MPEKRILLKNIDVPNQQNIDIYISSGGYEPLKKVLKTMQASEIIEEIKKSGLRGRGGAGFPTGLKWSFVPKDSPKPKYLCCNADEGEPGTFKDKLIMEKDPHLLIEGIIITCYAIDSHYAYIYIRGEFVKPAKILEKAIEEAYTKGFLGKNILNSGFNLDLVLHRGAGAYICGEETGLIESLEGKRGEPRLKPPFPAIVGLFKGPTVVNNVETLANVPRIIENGAAWFTGLGAEKNAGTKLYGVSGHVNKPGIYELEMGTPLREIIFDYAGGIRNNKKLKAVIPGGSSAPVLTENEIDVKMDFDSLAALGSMLGSGGIIVLDETVSIIKIMSRLAEFYSHESCGQCTPCREGVHWMKQILNRIEAGNKKTSDLDLLLDICDNIKGKTLCPLGDAAAMPIEGFIKKFRNECESYIQGKG